MALRFILAVAANREVGLVGALQRCASVTLT